MSRPTRSATLRLPMRDLTDRALDTAVQLGRGATPTSASSAGSTRSIAIKSGRVEGVASGESEGFGVRVLVDGAWGFASSSRPDRGRGRSGRRRGRPDRPGDRHRAPRPGPPRRSAAGPRHATRRRSRRTRSTSRSRRRSADLLAADAGRRGGQGRRLHRDALRRPARVEDVRRDRRQLTEQTFTHVGAGDRGQRDRGRRAPAPELPGRATAARSRRPATSTSAASTSSAAPSRSPRRPSRC